MFRQPKRQADGQTDASNVQTSHTPEQWAAKDAHRRAQNYLQTVEKTKPHTHTYTHTPPDCLSVCLSACVCFSTNLYMLELFLRHGGLYYPIPPPSSFISLTIPFLISLTPPHTHTHISHPDFFLLVPNNPPSSSTSPDSSLSLSLPPSPAGSFLAVLTAAP